MRSRSVRGGLALTEVSFGGAPIGGLYRQVTEDIARDTIRAAWDAGIRYFDTAPHYGAGLSERRLGAVLSDYPRDEYVLSTKVGRRLVDTSDVVVSNDIWAAPTTYRREWDFSRDGILRTLDDSMRRLKTDRVDIVFLHDPVDHWEQAAGEGFDTLADLRSQGVVTAIGAGMNQTALLDRFVRETDVDVIMLAGRYTLLEQDALDDLLPAAISMGTAIIAAGVFNSGLLAQATVPDDATYNYRPAPPQIMARARQIAALCAEFGISLPAAAVRFPLLHPAVVSVTLGMSEIQHVRLNVESYSATIPHELWEAMIAEGLLRADGSPGQRRRN